MVYFIAGCAVAYIAGAFTPAIGRKIKAFFSKEAKAAESAVVGKILK